MWNSDIKDIFIIVFATLSFCFAVSYLLVLRQSVKLKRDIAKLFIEKTLLQEYVDLTKSTKVKEQSEDTIHKEHFIKFLSDSRDWAYQYIEDVQKGLNKFVNDIDADISYFDEYGDALSMSRPDYPSMKNISKAYKELKTLISEDEIK
jgi:hypothetical protein